MGLYVIPMRLYVIPMRLYVIPNEVRNLFQLYKINY